MRPMTVSVLELHDELLAYEAKGTPGGARQAPDPFGVASPGQGGGRAHGIVADDRVVFMENGRIVEQGPPARIFDAPTDDRTRAFLRRVG